MHMCWVFLLCLVLCSPCVAFQQHTLLFVTASKPPYPAQQPLAPLRSSTGCWHLAGFFTQFGRVSKVRVSRNKKTGAAKHYAFLEFASPEVAAIAAEAMDGYMLFTQVRYAVKKVLVA